MLFTGDCDDRCPISFARVADIQHPVGFNSKHAFECNMLLAWLTRCKPVNPITAARVRGKISDVLRPLVIGKDDHVRATQEMLDQAGYVPAFDDTKNAEYDELDFHEFAAIALEMALVCFWMGWFDHVMKTLAPSAIQ